MIEQDDLPLEAEKIYLNPELSVPQIYLLFPFKELQSLDQADVKGVISQIIAEYLQGVGFLK